MFRNEMYNRHRSCYSKTYTFLYGAKIHKIHKYWGRDVC